MKISKHLLYHAITTFPFYQTSRSLNLANSHFSDDNLLLLLEHCKAFGKALEKIEIVSMNLSDQAVETLSQIIARWKIKQLTISKCGLKSKPFGKICMAILEGRSAETLDFSYNFIGNFFLVTLSDGYGAKFFCNLVKYFSPMKSFDLSCNEFDLAEMDHLKKTIANSLRFSSSDFKL